MSSSQSLSGIPHSTSAIVRHEERSFCIDTSLPFGQAPPASFDHANTAFDTLIGRPSPLSASHSTPCAFFSETISASLSE